MNDYMKLYYETEPETKVVFDSPDLGTYYFEGHLCAMEIAKKLWEFQKAYNGYNEELTELFENRFDFEHIENKVPNKVLISALRDNYDRHENKIESIILCRKLTNAGLKDAKDFVEKYVF